MRQKSLFNTVMVSKGVYEYFLASSCLNLSCKLVSCLQSDYLQKCCRYENLLTRLFVDVVLYEILSLLIEMSAQVTWIQSNAAYTSKKEQNYLWLYYLFICLIKMQLVFIEILKLAKCCICNIRLQNLVYF